MAELLKIVGHKKMSKRNMKNTLNNLPVLTLHRRMHTWAYHPLSKREYLPEFSSSSH